MLRAVLFPLSIALALPFSALAQEARPEVPEGMEFVTTVEGISEYQLESNGLRVLLFPDQTQPTITVNITYLVGSRHEGYGETGMAHLLEHMVFKGTPDHPNIPQELTEHGASPNGTTWYDRTNYFETFAATEENLRWALDLESDRMVNSFIAAEDLESEMTVVRNEFERGENSPRRILQERVLSTAYLWHNYGKSTIGARSDLENVPIERLQAFYRKYYQPDNAVLVIAGKIDPKPTLELVKEYFGPIPRPERKLYPTYTAEPVQDGERLVNLRRVGDLQVASVLYHTAPGSHPDYAALYLLNEILTSEPSGRLYKSLVETKKAASVSGFVPDLREAGYAYFSANVLKENSVEEASQVMLATIDSLKHDPPSDEEVERARAGVLKNLELTMNNSGYVGRLLSEYIASGDWRLLFLFRDRIEEVTPEDVSRVANYYFKPSNRTVGFFHPVDEVDRVEVPAPPDVPSMVANYQGKEGMAVGEAFDPSPANIESRTHRGSMGTTIDYALLPKETRGDAAVGHMILRFGNLEAMRGKRLAADLTGSMLDKGTGKYTRQEIQDKLDALKATLSIGGGSGRVSVILQSDRENMPALIDLLGEILTNPTFPEAEFEKLKQERLAQLQQSKSQPMALAQRRLSRAIRPYPQDDIRYTMSFEEEEAALKALTLDEVKAFYESFYGASNAQVGFVGDFDEEVVKERLEAALADWESPVTFARIPYEFFDVEPVDEKIETPDKANAAFFAMQPVKMRDDHPDYPAMVLGNYMLGGGFLNSRLATRIRQEEGLSYGVGSGFGAPALDETAQFYAYAIYAPENLEPLEKAFREEIEKVLTDGFTDEEVAAAKSGWLQSKQVERSQDISLAAKLDSYLFLDRTLEWDEDFEEKVENLTTEEVNAAMRKYLDYEKMSFVKAGDFANAAKGEAIKP